MKTCLSVCILTAMLLPSRASSQFEHLKVGVGISLNPIALHSNVIESYPYANPTTLIGIYLPVLINANIRLEPEGSVYVESSENSYPASADKQTTSIVRIGIGLFSVHAMENSFNLYFGPRLGFIFASIGRSDSRGTNIKIQETDYYVGACIGGEYSLSSHFTLGGEAQLNYFTFRNPDTTPGSASLPPSVTKNTLSTDGLVFLRWYF